jgi:3-dehydroquinate synthase
VKEDNCVKIDSLPYPVFIGDALWPELDLLLSPFPDKGGVYILTDYHTRNYCLPMLIHHLPELARQPVFSILPGEQSKEITNLEKIWTWLIENGAIKESLLINLGGGVVSDLGGFAAATFKRGIRYVNIPTSLIGQADAAVGGKTGINIFGIKNQAGLFYDPEAVFIFPEFLKTLPDDHLKSGFAEIIKCAVLSGKGFWEDVKKKNSLKNDHLTDLIVQTVNFKCGVVSGDPYDKSTRKMLNFGHTVGHAMESAYNMPGSIEISHGEAVAAGMICEAFMSHKTKGFPWNELEEITTVIKSVFNLKPVEFSIFDLILKMMFHDKKKTPAGIGFSLLKGIGNPCPEGHVNRTDLIRSFEYFNRIYKQ